MAYPFRQPTFFSEQGPFNSPIPTTIGQGASSTMTRVSSSNTGLYSSLAGALGSDHALAPQIQPITPPETMAYPLREPTFFAEQGPYNYPQLTAIGGGAYNPWSSTSTGVSHSTTSLYSSLAGALGSDSALVRQAQVVTLATPDPSEPAPPQGTSQESPAETNAPVANAGYGKGRGHAKYSKYVQPVKAPRPVMDRKYFNWGAPFLPFPDMVDFIKECFVERNALSQAGVRYIEENWVRHRNEDSTTVSEVPDPRTMETLSRHSQYKCHICYVDLASSAGRHSNSDRHRYIISQRLGIRMKKVPLIIQTYRCRTPGCDVE